MTDCQIDYFVLFSQNLTDFQTKVKRWRTQIQRLHVACRNAARPLPCTTRLARCEIQNQILWAACRGRQPLSSARSVHTCAPLARQSARGKRCAGRGRSRPICWQVDIPASQSRMPLSTCPPARSSPRPRLRRENPESSAYKTAWEQGGQGARARHPFSERDRRTQPPPPAKRLKRALDTTDR
jgi:hypothetical protein